MSYTIRANRLEPPDTTNTAPCSPSNCVLLPRTLVVAGALANGVDVAPVGLSLRVLQRVAVHLRRRGDEHTGAAALGQAKHVERAQKAGLGGLDGVPPATEVGASRWPETRSGRRFCTVPSPIKSITTPSVVNQDPTPTGTLDLLSLQMQH